MFAVCALEGVADSSTEYSMSSRALSPDNRHVDILLLIRELRMNHKVAANFYHQHGTEFVLSSHETRVHVIANADYYLASKPKGYSCILNSVCWPCAGVVLARAIRFNTMTICISYHQLGHDC